MFYLGPNSGGGNEGNGDLLQKSQARTAALSAPNPAAGHRRPHLCWRPLDTHGKSGPASCGLTARVSWVLVHKVLCELPRVCSPVLCKFWQLHSGVNGKFLQEGLCHTPACCTQSACPCSGPLLTRTSSGDTQTRFWLSLCSLWALVCTRGT